MANKSSKSYYIALGVASVGLAGVFALASYQNQEYVKELDKIEQEVNKMYCSMLAVEEEIIHTYPVEAAKAGLKLPMAEEKAGCEKLTTPHISP